MNEIVSGMNQTLKGGAGGGLGFLESITGQMTAILIVSLVIGLIVCFFGLKLMLIFVTLMGFLTGAGIGVAAGMKFQAEGVLLGGIALVVGTIFGIIFCKFYKIGVFFWMFLAVAGTAALIMQPATVPMICVCLGIGLVVAVLAVIFVEPLVILVTSMNGGLSAGSAAAGLLGMTSSPVVGLVAGVVIGVIGVIVQFAMRSKEMGRKERDFSKEIRARVSREMEVEKARNMLDTPDKKE